MSVMPLIIIQSIDPAAGSFTGVMPQVGGKPASISGPNCFSSGSGRVLHYHNLSDGGAFMSPATYPAQEEINKRPRHSVERQKALWHDNIGYELVEINSLINGAGPIQYDKLIVDDTPTIVPSEALTLTPTPDGSLTTFRFQLANERVIGAKDHTVITASDGTVFSSVGNGLLKAQKDGKEQQGGFVSLAFPPEAGPTVGEIRFITPPPVGTTVTAKYVHTGTVRVEALVNHAASASFRPSDPVYIRPGEHIRAVTAGGGEAQATVMIKPLFSGIPGGAPVHSSGI